MEKLSVYIINKYFEVALSVLILYRYLIMQVPISIMAFVKHPILEEFKESRKIQNPTLTLPFDKFLHK